MKKITLLLILSISITMTVYCQNNQDTLKVKNKSHVTYQVGKAKVTVWIEQRQGKYGEFAAKDFKIEKIYKKGNNWESTNIFNLDELLELRAAIDKAISEQGVKIKRE